MSYVTQVHITPVIASIHVCLHILCHQNNHKNGHLEQNRIFTNLTNKHYREIALSYAIGLAEHLTYTQDMKGCDLNRIEAIRSEENYWRSFKPWKDAVQKLQFASADHLPNRPYLGETKKHLVQRLLRIKRALLLLTRKESTCPPIQSAQDRTYYQNWLQRLGASYGPSNYKTIT